MTPLRRPNGPTIILAGLLTAGLGAPIAVVGVWYYTWLHVAPHMVAQVRSGIAAIDARDAVAAREIAEQLLTKRRLPPHQIGAPALLYGASVLIDAEESRPAARRRLAKAAAYYLRQAEVRGWPDGSGGRGPYLLGKAYLEGREFDAARAALEKAMTYEDFAARSLNQLARLELETPNPDLEQAVAYNNSLLALDNVRESVRRQAISRRIELALLQGRVADAHEAIEAAAWDRPVDVARWQGWADLLAARQSPDQRAEFLDSAMQRLREAAEPGDPRLGESLLLRGQAEALAGEIENAMKIWDRVIGQDPTAPEGVAAAMDYADALLVQRRFEEAIAAYASAFEQAPTAEIYSNVWLPLDEFHDRVADAYQQLSNRGEYRFAVQLVEAADRLLPDLVVAEWATEAYRREAIRAEDAGEDAAPTWRLAGDAMLRTARLRYASNEYPNDLWIAAEYFHHGGDARREAAVLKAYLEEEKYLRRSLALVRLAAAELEHGDPGAALKFCEECIQDFPEAIEVYAARLIAARVHSRLDQNDQAISLLQRNLTDDALRPDSIEWRQSLFLLGRLHHRLGMRQLEAAEKIDSQVQPTEYLDATEAAEAEFQVAVFKLEEAIVRYPGDPQALEARWLAAEAHRRSVAAPRARLEITTIQDTRLSLISRIRRELMAANSLLTDLIAELEAKRSAGSLNPNQDDLLRNSYFARGGVNFELEDYRTAADSFEAAALRYLSEPMALDAFVNLAACNEQLGNRNEAIGNLEQAKAVLAGLPEDADFSQTTNFERFQWAKHLDRLQTAMQP